jgi:hypothetical protein
MGGIMVQLALGVCMIAYALICFSKAFGVQLKQETI